MNHPNWIKEFPASITICDKDGKLIYLNDKAVKSFEKEGGEKLIGTNVIDCHPEGYSRDKVVEMLRDGSDNSYIIEKNNLKKFIYQSPWYKDGKYMGIAEFVIDIPGELPVHKRD